MSNADVSNSWKIKKQAHGRICKLMEERLPLWHNVIVKRERTWQISTRA
jgi:hypothetical protein